MDKYNLDSIMQLPLDKRPRELEQFAAWILIPQVMCDYLFDDETEKDEDLEDYFKEYRTLLTDFAFSKRINYRVFREFLQLFNPIFDEHFESVKRISDQQIQYVLARVKEERLKVLEIEVNEHEE